MKTLKMIITLCMLTTSALKSQLYTGLTAFPHTNGTVPAILSSGTITKLNYPGFIMAGYRPSISSGGYNLYIDKVAEDATYSGTSNFQYRYQLTSGGLSCSSTQNQELNCAGVSILETNQVGSSVYALTAAYDGGVLFATLDLNGSPVNSNFVNYHNTSATGYTKPVICRSVNNTNNYYIAGSYVVSGTRYMYVMEFDISGNLNWAYFYDQGTSTTMEPTAIIESPYTISPASELVVAGIVNTASNNKAFFMTIDCFGGSGTVNNYIEYSYSGTSNDEFHSIGIASSTVGCSAGYILGGYSDFLTTPAGRAWFLKIDASGTIGWSSFATPALNNTDGRVVSVHERYSNSNLAFEYYGAAVSSSSLGMMVLKLDANGVSYAGGGSSNSEFHYDDNAGNPSVVAALSFENSTPNVNEGIHVFGTTDNAATGGDYFLAQAVFNGAAANCNTPTDQYITQIVTTDVSTIPGTGGASPNVGSGLNVCSDFAFTGGTTSANPTTFCYDIVMPSIPYAGSNNRSTSITGLLNQNELKDMLFYPNPVNTALTIELTSTNFESASLEVFNCLGQSVLKMNIAQGGYPVSIDFKKLNLPSGIYSVTIDHEGEILKKKIVYSNE